jgi:hypothetical protein
MQQRVLQYFVWSDTRLGKSIYNVIMVINRQYVKAGDPAYQIVENRNTTYDSARYEIPGIYQDEKVFFTTSV